jgi:hypothetical protein
MSEPTAATLRDNPGSWTHDAVPMTSDPTRCAKCNRPTSAPEHVHPSHFVGDLTADTGRDDRYSRAELDAEREAPEYGTSADADARAAAVAEQLARNALTELNAVPDEDIRAAAVVGEPNPPVVLALIALAQYQTDTAARSPRSFLRDLGMPAAIDHQHDHPYTYQAHDFDPLPSDPTRCLHCTAFALEAAERVDCRICGANVAPTEFHLVADLPLSGHTAADRRI